MVLKPCFFIGKLKAQGGGASHGNRRPLKRSGSYGGLEEFQGAHGKRQKEGQEDQGRLKQLGGSVPKDLRELLRAL